MTTKQTGNDPSQKLADFLAVIREIAKSTLGLSDQEAARLTDAELVAYGREASVARESLNELLKEAGVDFPPLVPAAERSGVLPSRLHVEFTCRSWSEFRAVISGWTPQTRRLWRGQGSADWALLSEIERTGVAGAMGGQGDPRLGHYVYEGAKKLYLEPFRRAATPILGRVAVELDEKEWWALGRHYGLRTPLLDWSESPYVAAFFAFAQFANEKAPGYFDGKPRVGTGLSETEDRVAIWGLSTAESLFRDGEFELVEPPPFENVRQRAQQAVLTLLRVPMLRGLGEYLDERNRGVDLVKYTIPAHEWSAAMIDLRLMNIRLSTLFPDLQGAAAEANLGEFTLDVPRPGLASLRSTTPGRVDVDHPVAVLQGEPFALKVAAITSSGPAALRRVSLMAVGTSGWEPFGEYATDDEGHFALDVVAPGFATTLVIWVSVDGVQASYNGTIAVGADPSIAE